MVTLRRNKSGSIIKTITGNGGIAVTPGLISHFTVENAAGLAAFNAGTTVGGTELVDNEAIAAGVPGTFSIGIKILSTTTYYFSGITSITKITFYKL